MPTAPMATARFADFLKHELRKTDGMPLRFTYTPHPLVGMPIATLRQYVEGNDPATGAPIMQSIVDALTTPVSREEQAIEDRGAAQPRLLETDTEENLRRMFYENGWTDGLPIILPTEERVAEMLAGTSHPA
ncbi:MAG TPA: UGSC family (seleno)protein, partial [Blastocatellia bacterium]|nr:UGSC family (seleno)protein [Blastocatellia bacterium]